MTALHRDRGASPSISAAKSPRSWNAADWQPVAREFFCRPAPSVAPELLGCVLAHDTPEGLVAVELVEVEAYTGETDPASHAFRGKTARNAVMFGAPGHAYVYFTYGMHFCVNLVCQPAGEAAAVLLRAGRVVAGVDLAAARRAARVPVRADRLASGPARLCQALGIDRAQNGADVCDPVGPLTALARPEVTRLPVSSIARGPRVGVRNGSEVSWRFWIAEDAAVSAYRPHVPKRRAVSGRDAGDDGAPTGRKSDVTAEQRSGSMQQ